VADAGQESKETRSVESVVQDLQVMKEDCYAKAVNIGIASSIRH
jgi:hypothetical protein